MEGALLVQQVVEVGEEDELLLQQAGEEKEGLLILVRRDFLRVHELKQLVEVYLRETEEENSQLQQLLVEGGGKMRNLLEQLVEGEEELVLGLLENLCQLGWEVQSADHFAWHDEPQRGTFSCETQIIIKTLASLGLGC